METHPVILFDGVCNYCNAVVNFLIKQDKVKSFYFAPLQSTAAQQLLAKHDIHVKGLDSFILVEDSKVFVRSEAALRLVNHLPIYWIWLKIFWIVPRILRDAVYNLIARNRYKWFGKNEKCMVPNEELRERFLS